MATNYARATYQEIIDLNTTPDKPSIIGIHTPTGTRPYDMLKGFFGQFRKFRYGGCNVAIVPAAQLPADPLQVGYEAGEQIIDPRDLMNPILFHGAHGETLNTAFNVIYAAAFGNESTSAVEQFYSDTAGASAEAFYYTALSDPTFRKIGVMQGGMIKGLHPLVRPLSLSRPLLPNNVQGLTGDMSEKEVALKSNPEESVFPLTVENSRAFVTKASDTGTPVAEAVQTTMFTNGVRRLGWLPTAEFTNSDADFTTNLYNQPLVTLPKLFMGMFVFPPAYKQKLAFRMILTHYFEFKDFTSALQAGGVIGGNGSQNQPYNWLTTDATGTLSTNSVDGMNVEARPLTEGVS